MLPECEIWTAAHMLIEQARRQGKLTIAAEERAFNRAQELGAAGDVEGQKVYRAILRRVIELNLGEREAQRQ